MVVRDTEVDSVSVMQIQVAIELSLAHPGHGSPLGGIAVEGKDSFVSYHLWELLPALVGE
ncbi:hypothetical protein Hesp01_15000 [Herbidospora sp. NBRC 101105]|nr:hypothetical protein Hesp01_15000 [Herbidospora sp. NBRC 101105]